MNTNKKVIWITRTALFLAVALIAQFIGINVGGGLFGQVLTGSLVNMALIITGIVVGLSSGCTVALLSPILAFLFGIMQVVPAIPIVMAGNIVIVVLSSLLYKYFSAKTNSSLLQKLLILLGMIISACAKCAVMWISSIIFIPKLGAGLFASFALPQAITGTLGGILALIMIPSLLRVKRED